MTTINEPSRAIPPTICNFHFVQTGPPGYAIYDGEVYPYPPLPSDKGSDYRYAWGSTPVSLAVEFFGEGYTITPPGVEILEYRWDFGDGYVGYGPIVTHTYEVADPNTAISLTVLDSLGREYSTSKALSLVFVYFGYVSGYTIRGINTETPTKTLEGEARDTSLTVEGTPHRIWVARGGKPVREQEEVSLTTDRPTVATRYQRFATDTSLTSDTVSRQTKLSRQTTDESLTFDVAIQNMHRYPQATDTSTTSDAPGSRFLRALNAALSFTLGKPIH